MTIFTNINWYFFQSRIVRRVNGLIYFAQKIPVLGKHIPNSLYRERDLKTVISVIVAMIGFLSKIGLPFLIVGGFSVAFSVIRIGKIALSLNTAQAQGSILLLLLVTVIWPNIYKLFYEVTDLEILDFVRYFQISYVKTIRNLSFFKALSTLFFYLLPLSLLALLSQTSILSLILTYLAIRLFFFTAKEFLSRKLETKSLKKAPKITLIISLSLAFTGLLTALYHFKLSELLFTLPIALLLLLATAFFSHQILHFKNEQRYINQLVFASRTAQDERAELKKIARNADFAAGTAMQKDLTYNGSKDFGKGSGMLNKLLFYRYQESLKKSIYIRLFFFAVVLILIIAAVLISLFNGKLLFRISENNLLPIFPSLLFLMYFIGFSKKIVQMCFMNCDKSMLYYPFYRKSQTILSGFNERFKKTFLLNGIIVLGIFADILIPCLIFGKNISPQFYLILILFLIALNFLFSFHELFVYYLLQPFTADMAVVNPVYKIISGIFYVICWQSSRIHIKGYIFLAAVTVISLLYVGIGYIVIKRYAPTTFRFKT